MPRKIARLHLVSDILHNSATSIPNAWVYRSTLEVKLPAVFDHLGEIYLSFPGRMKAEQFRMQVINVGFFLLFSSLPIAVHSQLSVLTMVNILHRLSMSGKEIG